MVRRAAASKLGVSLCLQFLVEKCPLKMDLYSCVLYFGPIRGFDLSVANVTNFHVYLFLFTVISSQEFAKVVELEFVKTDLIPTFTSLSTDEQVLWNTKPTKIKRAAFQYISLGKKEPAQDF